MVRVQRSLEGRWSRFAERFERFSEAVGAGLTAWLATIEPPEDPLPNRKEVAVAERSSSFG